MSWLSALTAALRPHLAGAIGVLALCGLFSTILAGFHISAQRATIAAQAKSLTAKDDIIDGLSLAVTAQVSLRRLEQRNTLALQDKIAQVEEQSGSMATQIKQLEATNAQVRDFMARPVPDDLRRLLEQQ